MFALAGLLNTFITSGVHAEFNYNYAEVQVAKSDANGVNTAYGIAGSYDVQPNINIFGSFATVDVDATSDDLNTIQLGVGYHTPIAPTTDATANIQYINTEVPSLNSTRDESGVGLGVGIRHFFAEQIEGNASIDYSDVNDITNTSLSLGGRYYFSDTLSAGVGYTVDDDVDVVSGSLRMKFL